MAIAVKRANAKRKSAVKAVGKRRSRKTPESGVTAKRPGSKRPGSKLMASSKVVVLVATRKGAWLYRSDTARKAWRADGPHFLGHIVHHMVLDPRDGKMLLAAARTGHLGPTIFRSTDKGCNWKEAKKPPAFAKARKGETPRAVDHVFWLAPAHKDEANVWYAGTSPQGLFRSTDGGKSWAPFSSLNNNPKYFSWMGGVQDGTPDGPKLHSITVDPRDRAHIYIAMSGGSVHETIDGGKNWSPLVDGLEVVDGLDAANIAFHDPHCVRICPSNPDRLYQQNHCGIYRLDRPETKWRRIGKNMPKRVGDIGFPMVVHPRDDNTAFVFPMDGTTVWPRTSPEGRPAVFATHNGGKTWKRRASGLPQRDAWWTVKRQAMSADSKNPLGLYFGTAGGELWMSRNEGKSWKTIARNLPEIYAVEAY
ncbi:MAG: hypothetical protein V3S07_01105, partial [Micropepsaceae bacterium]